MKLKYVLLNAFTQSHFNGAQIAVFTQADSLMPAQMLQLAKELNLTESVFITKPERASSDAKVHIFSPQGAVDFAGHAMVAACYVMADTGIVKDSAAKIELNEQVLDVVLGLKNKKVQISIPVNEVYDEYVPANKELAQIIGLEEKDLGYNNFKPMIVGCPRPCLMVPVKNNDVLRGAQFHENKWQLSFVASLASQVLLFSGEHPYSNVNFTARLMGKGVHLNEDPPIGAVAPALGLYLAYGISDYHRSCIIQRGDVKSRISIMEVSVDKQMGVVDSVQLGGHAVKMAEGYFDIPDK